MLDGKKLFINSKQSILDALERMNSPYCQTLICVDENNRLQGLLSEGDIRRGLIEGINLRASLEKVMNSTPLYVNKQVTQKEATDLISNQVSVLPVVDVDKVVLGYYLFQHKDDPFTIQNKTITILGIGYVGLTLALILAEQGFKVNGYDRNADLIQQLQSKKAPFFEKGVEQLLDKHSNNNINFTKDIEKAKGGVYIITVGTPLLKEEKMPNIEYIRSAAASIGEQLCEGDLVLLRSTVPVGCSREIVLPTLEAASGLTCGQDFYLAFAPERTAEGVALKELKTNPQIIGAFDPISYDYASRIFQNLTKTVINVGGLEEAELCKLMDNTYRDHIFAYSNNLANLAEKLNINIHKLIKKVNYGYKRNHIPRPSPGVGGPCLSKDPYILASVFKEQELRTDLIMACRLVNEKAPVLLKDKLQRLLADAGKDINDANISLIGMAFKGEPETSDLRDSTSLWVLDQMPDRSKVSVYDPIIKEADIRALGVQVKTLEGAFKNADAVVILNNHKSYSSINLSKMLALMNKPAVFIDTWNNFNPLQIKQHNDVLYGGLGNN